MFRNILKVLAVLFLSHCYSVNAQNTDRANALSDQSQPGFSVLVQLSELVDSGKSVSDATNAMLSSTANETQSNQVNEVFSRLSNNSVLATQFFTSLLASGDLVEATKSTIEEYPEDAQDTMLLALALYPNYAQQILNAAVLTGEVDAEEALLIALNAGIDPTSVSAPTAAGLIADVGIAPVPLGVGLGAGGGGGGDRTASAN